MSLKKRQASTTDNWLHKEEIIPFVLAPQDTQGRNRSMRLEVTESIMSPLTLWSKITTPAEWFVPWSKKTEFPHCDLQNLQLVSPESVSCRKILSASVCLQNKKSAFLFVESLRPLTFKETILSELNSKFCMTFQKK